MKMPKPLVSIVIPLFNKADWISQTMASVANQDYDNWECIIVDDGSTDGSFELVSSLVEKLPGKWRLIRQENSGQSIARNHGLGLASGDFVA
jgi:glycosyltransferase involved in cell wall biosynthesis